MLKPTGARKAFRFLNRLGMTSLFLGLAATVLKAWVTYYLGPSEGRVVVAVAPVDGATSNEGQVSPPAESHIAGTVGAASRTIEDLLNASPVSLMRWQEMVERRDTTPTEQERQFRPFLGKEVVWEGFYEQCNLVENPQDDLHGCVLMLHESRGTLFTQQLLGPPRVRCWLQAQEADRLKKLNRGDWVVVRGRLKNANLAGSKLCTDLDDCEVISTATIRSVETAYHPLSGEGVTR